jgi:hypothetical protein
MLCRRIGSAWFNFAMVGLTKKGKVKLEFKPFVFHDFNRV